MTADDVLHNAIGALGLIVLAAILVAALSAFLPARSRYECVVCRFRPRARAALLQWGQRTWHRVVTKRRVWHRTAFRAWQHRHADTIAHAVGLHRA